MDADTVWTKLSFDLTELILSHLPLRSIVVAGAVCRHWRDVVAAPSFPRAAAASLPRRPWFFLYGHNNVHPGRNQAFAFDPAAGEWSPLPSPLLRADLFSGHGGFCFAAALSPTRFSFAPLLRGPWRLTSPVTFPRCSPLVAVVAGGRFLIAGGARFVGGLVDIEDRLAVEIYDPTTDSWELGPPLPTEFRVGNSSQWLSSALLGGGRLFFVCGIYSGAVASFDLALRAWTDVRILRPPGVLFAFLIASGDRLVLAGLCMSPAGPPRFVLWAIDQLTLEFTEIGAMPGDLLGCLFDSDDDDTRFASLKCVGLDGLVYVFNDDGHKGYPASVCEISAASCTWKMLPGLPSQINQFHKVVSFCSGVPLNTVLAPIPTAVAVDGEE